MIARGSALHHLVPRPEMSLDASLPSLHILSDGEMVGQGLYLEARKQPGAEWDLISAFKSMGAACILLMFRLENLKPLQMPTDFQLLT